MPPESDRRAQPVDVEGEASVVVRAGESIPVLDQDSVGEPPDGDDDGWPGPINEPERLFGA
jgi:hypothetical protein